MGDVARLGGLQTRWVACAAKHRGDSEPCRTEWVQVLTLGVWGPECPACYPQRIRPAATPEPVARVAAPKYSGAILADLEAAGVNVRKYGGATMAAAGDRQDAWSVATRDPMAFTRAAEWLARWEKRGRYTSSDWCFLYGTGSGYESGTLRIGLLGNGKTFLGIAMARSLIERGLLDPRRYRFVTAESLLMEAEATFRGDDESEHRMIRRYAAYDLLHVDDFGVRTQPKDHAVRLVGEIMDKRLAHDTIITSNLSIRTLQLAMPALSRVTDRIVGECGDGGRFVIPFRSTSRRELRSNLEVE